MSGTKGLIESNILIYLSNGLLEVSGLFEKYIELLISRITQIEVLGFPFDETENEELVRRLVDKFQILEIDSAVGEATISIRKQNKIKLPDALIYATALVNDCELITANVKDFSGITEGVIIYNPMTE